MTLPSTEELATTACPSCGHAMRMPVVSALWTEGMHGWMHVWDFASLVGSGTVGISRGQ
jgi:hypothetical protein